MKAKIVNSHICDLKPEINEIKMQLQNYLFTFLY